MTVPSLSVGSSAEAILSDPEISNNELNSMQSESMKTSDEVENIEGASQSSEELGKNNTICYLGMLCASLFVDTLHALRKIY